MMRIRYTEDEKTNLAALGKELDEITAAVEHVVRISGSSAFPMPKPKKKTLRDRFLVKCFTP